MSIKSVLGAELERISLSRKEINELSKSLGDIKVQSLHKNFSGFSIEFENRFRQIPSLNYHQWNMLNRIASMCLDLDM